MATISSLLSDHVSLQVRSVDRILLAGYVPRLQCDGQLVTFLNERAGGSIPSPAVLGKVGSAYVDEINRFAKANGIPLVRFTKTDVKEDVARPHAVERRRVGMPTARSGCSPPPRSPPGTASPRPSLGRSQTPSLPRSSRHEQHPDHQAGTATRPRPVPLRRSLRSRLSDTGRGSNPKLSVRQSR